LLKEHRLYRFGEFALDPVAKVLFRNGEPVHMTRKAVETLLVLVAHPGQVLTKEEIMNAVWTDRVVDEANLAQNIAVIRRTLGAAKGTPAFIETFPGRGYRLEGPVTAEPVRSSESEMESTDTGISATAPAPAPPRRKAARLYAAGVGVLLAVVVLATIWWTRDPRGASPGSAFRISAVTRMRGKEFQPSISADGSRIAFVWAEEGSSAPTVWVKANSSGSPRQLTSIAGHYSSPAWSPDGQNLAYLRIGRSSTEVIIADVDTGRERTVTILSPPNYGYDNRLMDWSPDGQLLAVSHSDAPSNPLGILLISVASGQKRTLTRPSPDVSGDVNPRFSPDGGRVTFVRLIHRLQQEIFSVPVAGGDARQVTRFGKQISGHDWMPNGDDIVFASDRTGEFRLWRFSVNAHNGPSTIRPVGIYGEFPIQLSVAQKAPVLVYSALHQDRNIWRLDLRDRSWKRLLASTGQDASPVYSPNGDRICFRSDRSGDEQLWVSTADGTDAVQITRGDWKPSVGRWSPDGQSIVTNSPQTGEVYVIENQDGAWAVRDLGAKGVHPVFSHDGKSIFAGGPAEIVRIPAVGGAATRVAPTKAEALVASADGKYLYYVPEPNDTSLWRLVLDGGQRERVLDSVVPGCTSCWSLGTDGIYYLGADKQSVDRQILLFHPFRGPERVVTPYPEPLWPLGSGPFSLSPNGRYLLSVRVDPSNSDVMLVSDFR
jgi:Tol biopolymer transport system component/DNA-binding winged helix-turn-helix (wHTH) protein